MTAWEMEGLAVMLQEERGEVSQGVLLTKKSPHTILIIWGAMVELHGFLLCKPLSIIERISFNAFLGCKGKSGVSTTAVPSNASFKALAIGQLPVAKNPCRNNIFFML